MLTYFLVWWHDGLHLLCAILCCFCFCCFFVFSFRCCLSGWSWRVWRCEELFLLLFHPSLSRIGPQISDYVPDSVWDDVSSHSSSLTFVSIRVGWRSGSLPGLYLIGSLLFLTTPSTSHLLSCHMVPHGTLVGRRWFFPGFPRV